MVTLRLVVVIPEVDGHACGHPGYDIAVQPIVEERVALVRFAIAVLDRPLDDPTLQELATERGYASPSHFARPADKTVDALPRPGDAGGRIERPRIQKFAGAGILQPLALRGRLIRGDGDVTRQRDAYREGQWRFHATKHARSTDTPPLSTRH